MHQAYSEFMEEYEDHGHINQINDDEGTIEELYYLPHQAIFKSSSSTTALILFLKVYVVQVMESLYNRLLVGPTIQEDMYSILL